MFFLPVFPSRFNGLSHIRGGHILFKNKGESVMFRIFHEVFSSLFSKKQILALVVMSFLATAASADEFTGTVRGFYINSSNQALVRLLNGTLVPNCVGTSWSFQFNPTTEVGKQCSAMLLAARMANRAIKIGYTASTTGACTVTHVFFWD